MAEFEDMDLESLLVSLQKQIDNSEETRKKDGKDIRLVVKQIDLELKAVITKGEEQESCLN